MVIGAVYCPIEKVSKISKEIRESKREYGLSKKNELKWTKVSPGKLEYYQNLINYFFSNEDLHFRAIIVPDKNVLRHEKYNQTHDDWYYKMYFDMLKVILDPENCYNIYLDMKDSKSASKVAKLHDVLSNNIYDFSRAIVKKVQVIRSEESEVLQLADLIIGALSYYFRKNSTSRSKLELIEMIKSLSGYSLEKSTLLRENKFNIFVWHSKDGD